MNNTNVFTTDGTDMPRRWATHTASGSIEAAAIAVISIFRGVVGMSIDDTRMTIDVHESRPTGSFAGANAQLLSSATAAALSTKYSRPASTFLAGSCGA